MNEIVDFFLMQAFFIGIILILHTYLGLHIIRRTLIFSDLALDQMAALGILMGILLGFSYGSLLSYVFALVFVLIGAFLLAYIIPKNNKIPREAVIASLYAIAMILSLLIGDKISGGGDYVLKTLSGSLLWVDWPIIFVNAVVYIALLIFHYAYRKKFFFLAEDLSFHGKKLWEFLFFTTQGIITVLVVPIAGVLLAYAFLMIPAATALLITYDWKKSILLGWFLGFFSCMSGIIISYNFNFPYSPTLILSMGAVFIFVVFFRIVKSSYFVLKR